MPRTTIERLLSLAQRTPSWCNIQPWQVVLTSGDATAQLAAALSTHHANGPATAPDVVFPPRYSGVYQDRRRECGHQLYAAVGIERSDRAGTDAQAAENFRLFGAPHFALITIPREIGPYALVDCGGYVSVFLLAAQALGLGAIPQAAVAAYSDWLRAWFGLDEDRLVVCGISFGFATASHKANGFRTSRAPLDKVVDWRS